jgi:hypothetical protein
MIGIAAALLLALGADADAEPANSPPSFGDQVPGRVLKAYVGELFASGFQATDRDGDRIELMAYRVPSGARFEVDELSGAAAESKPGRASVRDGNLTWKPSRAQRGLHRVTLVASDGRAQETLDVTIAVEERWAAWALPGAQYVAYFPSGRGEGVFHGPSFELVIASWIHDTSQRGPSHGRVYFDLALLDSTRADGSTGVSYALGMDLSLERNPRRRFLVPVFGVEVGGVQHQLGGVFQTVPFVGAHLWSDRNIFFTTSVGYVVSGRDAERFGGWRVRAGMDFAL